MRTLFVLLLLLPITCFGQVKKLKPEFRNLSWIMDFKAAEVVTTLSHHYGNDSLKVPDSSFVTQDRYNLYYDSLSLWFITKDAFKENDSKAKSTIIGGFTESKTKHTNAEWIKIYDAETRESYAANNNSTIGDHGCIPSTWSNLNFFYAKESNYIKPYNGGRIKVYSYQSTTDYDSKEFDIHIHDTINFFLAFHKTIQPTDNHGVCWYGDWQPYCYFYPKPKKVVYPAPISKVWESKTGLPYSVAQELQLTDDRIPKILALLGTVNDDVLLKETLPVSKEYNIAVKCDTCTVKLFDNHTEDNDTIDFTYKDSTAQVPIKNDGTYYKIVLAQDNMFYIFAVSEGYLETCTIDALIDGHHHVFALKKGERVLIRLNKI